MTTTQIKVGKTYKTVVGDCTVEIVAGPLENNSHPWIGILTDDDFQSVVTYNDEGEVLGPDNWKHLALPQPAILLSDVKRILSQVRNKALGSGEYCPLHLMDEAFKIAPVTYVEIPR